MGVIKGDTASLDHSLHSLLTSERAGYHPGTRHHTHRGAFWLLVGNKQI